MHHFVTAPHALVIGIVLIILFTRSRLFPPRSN
jgi:hypothetical protein